jgi:hypothetical protein
VTALVRAPAHAPFCGAIPVNPDGLPAGRIRANPDLSFCRTGWEPLRLCLDTVMLIYLAWNLDEVGGAFGLAGSPLEQGYGPTISSCRQAQPALL